MVLAENFRLIRSVARSRCDRSAAERLVNSSIVISRVQYYRV